MNLPCSIIRQILSPVGLIFWRVADVPKRFANNGDDRRFVDCKFSRRANVQRKARPRPTENRLTNLTPLRFRRYFDNNNAGLVASGILKRNMQVAIRFDFHSNNAASERVPFTFNSGGLSSQKPNVSPAASEPMATSGIEGLPPITVELKDEILSTLISRHVSFKHFREQTLAKPSDADSNPSVSRARADSTGLDAASARTGNRHMLRKSYWCFFTRVVASGG